MEPSLRKATLFPFVLAWKFIRDYLLLPPVYVVGRIIGFFVMFFALAVYTVSCHIACHKGLLPREYIFGVRGKKGAPARKDTRESSEF
mmetsp:Transcript_9148/g.36896  ORF Transcript_9148/g.36896 Transcript_9148/m.36896 type:complete len:88 (-) Transcript_9148:194-457(-)